MTRGDVVIVEFPYADGRPGKIQRVKVSDFNPIGRNTQGVRIMSLDEVDTLAAIVCVPTEEREEEGESGAEMAPET